MLPLLLTAARDGLLTLDDVIDRCSVNPRRIYGLPDQPNTYIEVDVNTEFALSNDEMITYCGWTPFVRRRVVGRVERVVLRGDTVYEDGTILAEPGSGTVLFAEQKG